MKTGHSSFTGPFLGLILLIMMLAGCAGGPTSSTSSTPSAGAPDAPATTTTTTASTASLETDPVAGQPRALPPSVVLPHPAAHLESPIPFAWSLPTNLLPPPGKQGSLNACVPFALGYAQASIVFNEAAPGNATNPALQYSPAWLYAMALNRQGGSPGDGTNHAEVLDILINQGCRNMQDYPYPDASLGFSVMAGDILDIMQANPPADPAFKLGSASYIDLPATYPDAMHNLRPIRDQIAANHPVGLGTFTPAQLQGWRNKTNDDVMSDLALTPGGTHCMCIIGYDDLKTYTLANGTRQSGAFLLQNSFGPTFGDGGRFWMSYDLTWLCHRFACVEALPTTPADSLTRARMQAVEGPAARLTEVHQAPDPDATGTIYLVMQCCFDQPVTITDITLTAPNGQKVSQSLHMALHDGYLHFERNDARQFPLGTYQLDLSTDNHGPYHTSFDLTAADSSACNNQTTPYDNGLPSTMKGTGFGPVTIR
jgi:hypothetical protein